MAIDFVSLGRRIQSKRKQITKTQENMAEYLGVSVGYISQIERGITKVNLETLSEITEFLSCPIAELFDGAVENSSTYLLADLAETFSRLSARDKRLLLNIANMMAAEC